MTEVQTGLCHLLDLLPQWMTQSGPLRLGLSLLGKMQKQGKLITAPASRNALAFIHQRPRAER